MGRFVVQKLFEQIHLMIDNQRLRKFGLLQEGIDMLIVGYRERNVCITPENDRYLVLFAET